MAQPQPLTEEALHQKSSQQLTGLLYEACISKLRRASEALKEGRELEANGLLQKCNDILYRLGAGLNYDAGIIADQLDMLYNYMAGRLVEANARKDPGGVDEVLALLLSVAASWEIACSKRTDPKAALKQKQARAYEPGLPQHIPSLNMME